MDTRQTRIANSALWAAYGDALGFMSELTDSAGLEYRTGRKFIEETVPWRRVVGGRGGASLSLPAGVYSDDTQLRLSTARSIRPDGNFDVEVFSKVELPLFAFYGLGSGRSTKAAASNLTRSAIAWFSNFFGEGGSLYTQAGGNGPASRIQPHIWASSNPGSDADLLDVLRNSICTHGHPRAIVGALFHAQSLAFVWRERRLPSPNEWSDLIDFASIMRLIEGDHQISNFWLPSWERIAGTPFCDVLQEVFDELVNALTTIETSMSRLEQESYVECLRLLGCLEDEHRGSGLLTPLMATAISYLAEQEENFSAPTDALIIIANAIGSDTDSIATMAGALLGLITVDEPEFNLLDRDLIRHDAYRMFRISCNSEKNQVKYPDIMTWTIPRNVGEAIKKHGEAFSMAVFGRLLSISLPQKSRVGNSSFYFLRSDLGQTLIVRIPDSQKAEDQTVFEFNSNEKPGKNPNKPSSDNATTPRTQKGGLSLLDDLTNEVIEANFDPMLIGQHIHYMAQWPNSIEMSVAYIAIISKALRVRIRRGRL